MEYAEIDLTKREDMATGKPVPVHECAGGPHYFWDGWSWSLYLYDGDVTPVFCMVCGKKLPAIKGD